MKDWKLIAEKQAEYIEHLKSPTPTIESYAAWRKKNNVFESELSALESQEVEGVADNDTIEDGFGSSWSIVCPMCGKKSMQVVRPGKVQCEYCG